MHQGKNRVIQKYNFSEDNLILVEGGSQKIFLDLISPFHLVEADS